MENFTKLAPRGFFLHVEVFPS